MPPSSNIYLHPKLWFNILKHLFPEELAAVSMVSRRLNNVASDDKLWWPQVWEYFPQHEDWLKNRTKKEKRNSTAKKIFKFLCEIESETIFYNSGSTLLLAMIRKKKIYKLYQLYETHVFHWPFYSIYELYRYHRVPITCTLAELAVEFKVYLDAKDADKDWRERQMLPEILPNGINRKIEENLQLQLCRPIWPYEPRWAPKDTKNLIRNAFKLIKKYFVSKTELNVMGSEESEEIDLSNRDIDERKLEPRSKLTLPVIFHLAVSRNKPDIVCLLREAALTSKILGKSLKLATRKRYESIVKYLVHHKLTNQADKVAALKIAVKDNQLYMSRYLLENIKMDARVEEQALHWAAKKHHHEMLILLLKKFENIFNFLPPLKKEAWSEVFKMPDFNLYVAIKRNGYGFSGESYVVIFNLDNAQTVELALKEVKQIALWLQRKCFPIQQWDNPEFHQSYHCIMGIKEYNRAPAVIFCMGKIAFSNEVKDHFEIKYPKIDDSELEASSDTQSLTFAFNNMQLNLEDTSGEKQQVLKIHQSFSC